MARTENPEKKVKIRIAFPKRLVDRVQEEAWEVGMSFQQYVRVLLAAHVQLPHAETSRLQNLGEIRLKTKIKDLAVEEERLSRALGRVSKRIDKKKKEKVAQKDELTDEEIWEIVNEQIKSEKQR